MVVPDRCKVLMLIVTWMACLMTMLTSHSFIRESGDLNRIHIPTLRFCHGARDIAAKECSKNNSGGSGNVVSADQTNAVSNGSSTGRLRGLTLSSSSSSLSLCAQRTAEAQQCEVAIQRAERWINLGGCAQAIQAQTICEAEWCRIAIHNLESQQACNTECAVVRQKLQDCVQQMVSQEWKRSGLQLLPTQQQ